MKREKDIVLRRVVPIALIVILLALTLGLSIVFISHIEKKEEEEGPSIYSEYMSYLRDDVRYVDTIKLHSHDAGIVNSHVMALKTTFLDCQKDPIYTQLNYGVRSFDLRVARSSYTGKGDGVIYFAHGVGISEISLESALRDMRQFRDEHPSEFIEIDLVWESRSETYLSEEDVEYVKSKINTYLEPEKYAFPAGTDLETITMKEMRESGKNFMISSDWCDPAYNSGRSPRNGTMGGADFPHLEDGPAMYQYLHDLVGSPDVGAHLLPGFGRSTGEGSGIKKITPLEYMLYDRESFETFMRYLEENPALLNNIAGFGFDMITYDYVQPGRALLLNAIKGTVKPELKNEYVSLMAMSFNYAIPSMYEIA
ncbi:MAG: hypothetical protein LBT55_06400 [Clostridiaceae bacterium]|jgi:hypothetical protein|nr:hypothetical protein [Clostridiaceae bacterium]